LAGGGADWLGDAGAEAGPAWARAKLGDSIAVAASNRILRRKVIPPTDT
jgi:hypothetical protein